MQIQLILQCCQTETSGVNWKTRHLNTADLSIPLTKTTALHFQLGVVIFVCHSSAPEAEVRRWQVRGWAMLVKFQKKKKPSGCFPQKSF